MIKVALVVAGLTVSEKENFSGCIVDSSGQRRMARLF